MDVPVRNQPVIIGGDTATPVFTYQYAAAPGYTSEAGYYWLPQHMAIESSHGHVKVDNAYLAIDHYNDDLSTCMTTGDNNFPTPHIVKWHTRT